MPRFHDPMHAWCPCKPGPILNSMNTTVDEPLQSAAPTGWSEKSWQPPQQENAGRNVSITRLQMIDAVWKHLAGRCVLLLPGRSSRNRRRERWERKRRRAILMNHHLPSPENWVLNEKWMIWSEHKHVHVEAPKTKKENLTAENL